jgi:DNA-binding response OmpR family regulator
MAEVQIGVHYATMTMNAILPPDFSLDEAFQYPPNARQRILVADDEPDLRRLCSEVLIRIGYHVDSAEDGAVAWQALNDQRYDLLLTDNKMPKVTGIDLLRKVHAARLALPVIMVTATEPLEVFARAPWLQPAMTLLKPFALAELVGAVKQVLRAAANASQQVPPPPNWESPTIAFADKPIGAVAKLNRFG